MTTMDYETKAEAHGAIHRILEGHVGRSEAISAGEIGALIGIHTDPGHVRARSLILGAIRARRIPVGACSGGYYILRDEAELDDYIDRLDRRMAAMARRKAFVYHAFNTRPVAPAMVQGRGLI